jgi:hypothetical protein
MYEFVAGFEAGVLSTLAGIVVTIVAIAVSLARRIGNGK